MSQWELNSGVQMAEVRYTFFLDKMQVYLAYKFGDGSFGTIALRYYLNSSKILT